MQIRELVLYGYNGKVRHLPFALGQVNIITGRSKSGKSVVGDIIDYCLGGDSCNIADGVVRDNVAWYGLLLQFEHERVFVARKNPDKGQQTTGVCYIDIGEKIEAPDNCDFSSNTNVSGIEESLTRRIGISENLNTPPEGQSRLPLAANIRHALYYCFQGQDEIAAKNFLFHHQSDDFITQAIKDTIPYFLGAISEEALTLENERSILKRKLTLEKRKLEENRNLMGGGSERAISLIGEARQAGLIDRDSVEERKQSALSRIQEDMTKWAKALQLEHSDNPYRLDLNKVTVVVDKPERPVPLKQLGSGSNWVGVHLIAYFALQRFFVNANRPVPRFLFLDQPSQVYFPSELDEKQIDWNEVNIMYQFIIDRTIELNGKLQVIVVDHADLKEDSFRQFICENWWPIDKNLVPSDWYENTSQQ